MRDIILETIGNVKMLWEEKSLIEPEKNCLNNNECEEGDIMNETKNGSTPTPCVNIGKISGIYKIINKINGEYYVGGTNNLHKRWIEHKNLLKRNVHDNDHLQKAWNKYRETRFEFIMECEVISYKLIEEEQKYLDICKSLPDTNYNIS
jgi:predicted GIY-YIG superfamily endonuclease